MHYFQKIIPTILFAFFIYSTLSGQILDKSWEEIMMNKQDSWFSSEEAISIAENVLLYQRNIGGWPKNIQMQKPLGEMEKQLIRNKKNDLTGITTDNGATTHEMLFLSKMYRQLPDERYKNAFLRGLDYLLEAQYENGGWPQYYPLRKGYYAHITYNDNSMVNILSLLGEIVNRTDFYSIRPSEETMVRVQKAFEKGIDCILKTQYKQDGVLTSWCAQYDENTLEPAKARSYELPSLSGKESAQIVLFLMSIENPSKEIINSVNSAVEWMDKVKISGLRRIIVYNEEGKIVHKEMQQDPNAPLLWARFMDLEDNKPFFCDRDGIKKSTLAEIGAERRNGYAWYTDEPKEVLEKYPRWKEKHLTANYEKNVTQNILDGTYDFVVSKDGSGDFSSIQEAINNAKAFPYQRIRIFIKNGLYYEKVKIHEWNSNISLIGESKENTIISFDDYFSKIGLGRNSTFYTYTLLVEADDVVLNNLTIQNTSGKVGQAVALSIFSNRVAVINCRILGNQDTLYASGKGKQYYKDCYIEGTTDFIFGSATAYFENCHIHCKKNSYITAASTPEGTKYGYVFKDCEITAEPDVDKVYLGRPWRIYARTVFIYCKLGKHILPQGWHNWSKPEAEKTSFYAEFENYGEGFQPEKRVSWSHQLSKAEAKSYTLENVLIHHQKTLSQKWFNQN